MSGAVCVPRLAVDGVLDSDALSLECLDQEGHLHREVTAFVDCDWQHGAVAERVETQKERGSHERTQQGVGVAGVQRERTHGVPPHQLEGREDLAVLRSLCSQIRGQTVLRKLKRVGDVAVCPQQRTHSVCVRARQRRARVVVADVEDGQRVQPDHGRKDTSKNRFEYYEDIMQLKTPARIDLSTMRISCKKRHQQE